MKRRVRNDLRQLRHLERSINSLLELHDSYERRIKFLNVHPSEAADTELIKLRRLLSKLDAMGIIARASELEARYVAEIDALDPLDRIIMVDAFFNGRPYWQIGRDVGYTERGVQNRVNIIIDKMASRIEK